MDELRILNNALLLIELFYIIIMQWRVQDFGLTVEGLENQLFIWLCLAIFL